MINAMLSSSGILGKMWGEAVLSACYILNRVPHKKLDKTPYELWKGYAPNLNYLKVWGCLAKVAYPEFRKTNIAFLNGDLEEKIYMEQPEGFVVPRLESKVTDNHEVSSTSGYVFTLGGGAISWKSAKQTCIVRSTMESKFIVLELAGQEVEWLRNLVGDIPLWGSSVPVSLHCDSQTAIGIAKNYAYNGKRRHIRIRHGVEKELLKNGIISLDYVRSERNFADPLTKGLTRRIILETSRAMELKPLE
ncbi:UNVERIFIED_CONTAM: Retrovirus-related Pol polyprotein from transposon TNT 1-94 [Sesamum angustifolium]|uniref:Retrovirus-related Pol polyprotein from transposon TNT 1-94 n=1 Tax=Sesamum angustifolium TaxID=2727405 RepID=A0AAW2PW86_9LAMI